MKELRRTDWFLWSCDLESCDTIATTHPKALGEYDAPPGWVTIGPPRYWKGPDLAFCQIAHRDQFMGDHLHAQLQLTSGAATAKLVSS